MCIRDRVHILGMDFSIGSCLQVLVAGTMAGIMFSMIAIESGSVWNLSLIHILEPDLLLLDVNLPQQSGFEICKSVRKTSDVPIIFLRCV